MRSQRATSDSCDAWETWDYCGLDVERLRIRAGYYARKAGASDISAGEALDATCQLSRTRHGVTV